MLPKRRLRRLSRSRLHRKLNRSPNQRRRLCQSRLLRRRWYRPRLQRASAWLKSLEADPQSHMLRLSVARAGGQLGNPDFSIQQYRYLIRNNALLDMIVDDLQDLIADADERQLQKRLHRTLGSP
jgi:hypothetical protein